MMKELYGFKLGDMVEVVEVYNRSLPRGRQGTVVHFLNHPLTNIGVQWDNFTGGHGCDNTCPEGTGYYVPHKTIKKVYKNLLKWLEDQ